MENSRHLISFSLFSLLVADVVNANCCTVRAQRLLVRYSTEVLRTEYVPRRLSCTYRGIFFGLLKLEI